MNPPVGKSRNEKTSTLQKDCKKCASFEKENKSLKGDIQLQMKEIRNLKEKLKQKESQVSKLQESMKSKSPEKTPEKSTEKVVPKKKEEKEIPK